MALEGEVLADGAEVSEKGLGARRPSKASHAALALTGGLMAVLGAVVYLGTGLQPSMGSILRCVECPDHGGDTIFANMVLVYDNLPKLIKERIAELTA